MLMTVARLYCTRLLIAMMIIDWILNPLMSMDARMSLGARGLGKSVASRTSLVVNWRGRKGGSIWI